MSNKNEKSTFPTLNSIASKFGFHRNTVSKWFAYPDAPKKGPNGFDFDQVAEFIKACAEREKSQAKADPQMAAAKLEEVLERVRKIRRLNDQAEAKLMLVTDMEVQVRGMANAVQRLLNDLPNRLATDLSGRSPVEVYARMKKVVDEILYALCAGGSPEACAWAADEVAHARQTPREQWPKFPVRTDGYSDRLKELTVEKPQTPENIGESDAITSP